LEHATACSGEYAGQEDILPVSRTFGSMLALAGFSPSIEIKPVVSANLEDELGGAERLPGTTIRVREVHVVCSEQDNIALDLERPITREHIFESQAQQESSVDRGARLRKPIRITEVVAEAPPDNATFHVNQELIESDTGPGSGGKIPWICGRCLFGEAVECKIILRLQERAPRLGLESDDEASELVVAPDLST
jgi:hypothetical protein